MNFLYLLAASVSLILLVLGIWKRHSIYKWIKKNKKKTVAIGTSLIAVLAGAGTLFIDVGGSGSAPTITDISPIDESIDNSISLTWSATVEDPEGDAIYWSIECSNGQSNSAQGSLPYNDATLPDTGDNFTLKWSADAVNSLHVAPYSPASVIDIDGDGIQEIFLGGKTRPDYDDDQYTSNLTFVCVDGSNGNPIWFFNQTTGYEDSSNNNFYPMVYDFVSSNEGYEVIKSCGVSYQHCLDADDGSIIWNVSSYESGWHQQGFIDDGDEVYLYIIDGDGGTPTTGLYKLYASNATEIATYPVEYTCWGGISIADLNPDDNDGYEIIYGGNGDGIVCLDEDLNELWDRTDIIETSQSPFLIDCCGDSDLEIVCCDQLGDDKLYILNSTNGNTLEVSSTTESWHCQPAVGQTQDDGSWQIITSNSDTPATIYNISTATELQTLELTGGDTDGMIGPCIMDCLDDPEGLNEIFLGSQNGLDTQIWRWNTTSHVYENINFTSDGHLNTPSDGRFPTATVDTTSWSILSDIDYDGYYELLTYRVYISSVNTLFCFETEMPVDNPRPTTNVEYQSLSRLNNNEYIALPGNPRVSYEFIENNGTKSLDLTGLSFSTTYNIWINVSDGNSWNNDTYTFTTKDLPAPTGFYSNESGDTTVNLEWVNSDDADKTRVERNTIENWDVGEGTLIYNDTGTSDSDTVDSNDNVYYYRAWSWNDTAKEYSSDNDYDFTWGELTLKWEVVLPNAPATVDIPPAVFDIDGDGDMELFFCSGTYSDPDGDSYIHGWDHNGDELWDEIEIDYDSGSANHLPISIADVDGDGNYEFCHGGDKTYMRNCENGTILWENSTHLSSYHVNGLVNINDTYYLYVAGPDPSDESIKKLYAENGTQVEIDGSPVESSINHISNSGFSIADINNDGFLEIVIGERDYDGGVGVACYDENLNMIWNQNNVTSSSNCVALIDTNDDGYLDVISMDQSSGDYFINSGEDGSFISGSKGTFSTHTTSSFWDLDGDGDLEGIIGYYNGADSGNCRVYDVSTNTLEHDFGASYQTSEPSDICDILGDSNKEIYISSGWDGDGIGAYYDGSYQIIKETSDIPSSPWSGWSWVGDIDNDGYKEVIVHEGGASPSIICMDSPRPVNNNEPIVDTPFYGLRRVNNEEYYAPIYMFNETIRNTDDDYFTWMGKNMSAWNVAKHISGFNETGDEDSSEFIAIWDNGAWDPTHANWKKFYGDGTGTNFTVHTFDVIYIHLDDSDTQKIYMLRNPDIDYDAQRTVSLTKSDANKGYNYIGYTDDDVSTLEDVADKSNLETYESVLWWNRTSFGWEAWIIGFSTVNHNINENDVFIMKVSETRSIDIGD